MGAGVPVKVRKINAKLVLQLRNQGLLRRAIESAQGMFRHGIQAVREGEVVLNDGYREMAVHYSAAVLPGRVRAPKDQAGVDGVLHPLFAEGLAPASRPRCLRGCDHGPDHPQHDPGRDGHLQHEGAHGSCQRVIRDGKRQWCRAMSSLVLSRTIGGAQSLKYSLPQLALNTLFHNAVRLPFNYYVRVFSNAYSVDPSFNGRIVEVTADLDIDRVTHGGSSSAPMSWPGPCAWC